MGGGRQPKEVGAAKRIAVKSGNSTNKGGECKQEAAALTRCCAAAPGAKEYQVVGRKRRKRRRRGGSGRRRGRGEEKTEVGLSLHVPSVSIRPKQTSARWTLQDVYTYIYI